MFTGKYWISGQPVYVDVRTCTDAEFTKVIDLLVWDCAWNLVAKFNQARHWAQKAPIQS